MGLAYNLLNFAVKPVERGVQYPERMPKQQSLADRLQFIMAEMGWNQAELAREMGCTRAAVNNYISGFSKKVDPKFAFRLQDHHRWNARWILEGEPPARIEPLTPREEALLAKLRALPEERRRALVLILENL